MDISDEDAMKMLDDMNWNDNIDINDYSNNTDKNDENDDISKQHNNDDNIVDDDMIAILDSIRNEKANTNNNDTTSINKNIVFKHKYAEFQIDTETLMKWNADCAAAKDDDDDNDNNITTNMTNENNNNKDNNDTKNNNDLHT